MRMISAIHVTFFAFSTCLGKFMKPNVFHKIIKSSFSTTSLKSSIVEGDCASITKNFITNLIDDDLRANRNGGRVLTRFPPEPNGYLHLGHAKSICLNFGVAQAYGGKTNMRFDDTNPEKEEMEYINSILRDVRWLINGENGTDPWDGQIRHASDYFEGIYSAAVYLIKQGLAYVDDLSQEEMRQYRGTLTEPGRDSPHRTRTIDENLRLFEDMRAGKFPDGHCVLRAKIDNSSPNMNMRDPTLYRIKNAVHPITGSKWCIYPMYDFAHALSDAFEGITHSLCTLEFADHRPLYDWCIERVQPSGLLPNSAEGWRPRQTEFSRLNLQYTVLSKRKLIQLVTGRHVDGWDDPRLPTISGLRRRGYPSAAIRLFCERIGISRAEGTIEIDVFEETMREHLDAEAPRIFAVAEPLKLTITNWIPDAEDTFTVENHPKRTEYGAREIKFTNELLIDKSDFFDTGVKGDLPPPKGFKRLLLNNCVRLKNAFVVTCYDVVRDPVTGDVTEVLCTYDRDTSNGRNSPNSKKPKGIVQWVSQKYGVPVQLNIYDRLFSTPIPGRDHPEGDFLHDINADSKSIVTNAYIEPSIANWATGSVFQFERLGYFYLDPVSNPSLPQQEGNSVMSKDKNPSYIFNRVVTLKDTWQQALVDREGPATASTPESAALTAEYYRLDIRVGQVMSVEQHPAAENLYIQQIDCGDEKGPRVVVSGLVKYLESDQLLGKKVVVLCNLKPSKFRGVMSEGMVLTAVQESSTTGPDGTATSTITALELISPPANAKAGENLYLSLSDVNQPSTTTLSKDAWLKIAPKLRVNEKKELCFDGPQNSLKTKKGPCVTTSLTETQVQ